MWISTQRQVQGLTSQHQLYRKHPSLANPRGHFLSERLHRCREGTPREMRRGDRGGHCRLFLGVWPRQGGDAMAGPAVQCGSFLRAVQKMRLSCWHRACAQCPGQLASVPVTAWITASEAQLGLAATTETHSRPRQVHGGSPPGAPQGVCRSAVTTWALEGEPHISQSGEAGPQAQSKSSLRKHKRGCRSFRRSWSVLLELSLPCGAAGPSYCAEPQPQGGGGGSFSSGWEETSGQEDRLCRVGQVVR